MTLSSQYESVCLTCMIPLYSVSFFLFFSLLMHACSQADVDVAQADEDVEMLRVTANTLLNLVNIPSSDQTS